jgi:hypothetical protein
VRTDGPLDSAVKYHLQTWPLLNPNIIF